MKLLLVLSSVVAVSGAMATAPAKPEAFVVKEVRQSGNLMPGPGRRRPVRSVLIVEAISNGCTKADDFDVQVKDTAQFQEVTLVRKNPDICDAPAAKLAFDLETDRLSPSYRKPIRVMNPLIVEERFVH
jgi:hypothetical protein